MHYWISVCFAVSHEMTFTKSKVTSAVFPRACYCPPPNLRTSTSVMGWARAGFVSALDRDPHQLRSSAQFSHFFLHLLSFFPLLNLGYSLHLLS